MLARASLLLPTVVLILSVCSSSPAFQAREHLTPQEIDLELSLRAHGPRLSIIRRSTPSEYAVWIKEIEDFARKGRTEALNSFYGHTVLKDGPQKSTDPKDKPLEKN
jgi:hypothetical protein